MNLRLRRAAVAPSPTYYRMPWRYDDGGRAAAGFKGTTGDCVVRAIAIAAELPYTVVYDGLNDYCREEGYGPRARTGVPPRLIRGYLDELGWAWTPTMHIGSGTTVHLRADELPGGRIITRLTRHLCAVVDGTIHDTGDPSRAGTRCVYGLWSAP